MAKRLPVPPELEHLLEKREQDADRRATQRRGEAGPLPADPTADKQERRKQADRRRKRRRKAE